MNAPDVVLRDVTLRDGLQDEAPIATADKLAIYEALVAAGVIDLELTSFVRPDRVPAMADAEAMCAATDHDGAPTRWGLVLNLRGAQRALDAGLDHLQYVVSVSDTHSRHNAGASTDDAVAGLAAVVAEAAPRGATVEVTLATAFGCPYELQIDAGRVVEVATACTAAGATAIGLADTIGVAIPSEVAHLIDVVRPEVGVPIGVHLHDTRGLGIANALTAIEHGVRRVDGSVGGLGGCPFAPGASGNLALEDLAHALEASGVSTGVDLDALIAAAHVATDAVGRSVGSKVGVAGPRFAATATPG
ncbi:MAG: hydroxymethylglutaryl-CoA lyase [Ilumatobacter sp.]|nr:hydroxymethylglutaryl-CoA lyase [Ilumatobacter sp.]